ncbi:hypothetical protein EBZ37_04840, partial [bacterium]|nr:hypothetical protein [bacterium]
SIGFIRNGSLQACRAEETGMGTVNTTFRSRFGTDFATAEERKLQYNINKESSGGPENETLEEIYLRVLRTMKDSIEAHLENTLDARPESILLVGGGSRSPGIDIAISNLFRIPAVKANPFKNIQIYSGDKSGGDDEIGSLAPLMTTAVGLALRGIK